MGQLWQAPAVRVRPHTYSPASDAGGRQVGEPGNSHAMRKPSIDGCLDQVGREEGERDRHVHRSPHAFGIRNGVGNEFVEPTAPPASLMTKNEVPEQTTERRTPRRFSGG